MRENVTLSMKQRAAIAALLTSSDVTKAADAAGCSRATLYRWMGDPTFRMALQAAEADAMRSLAREMAGLGSLVAGAIRDALSEKESIGIRLRAADMVLARGPALQDLVNVLDRLERLEAALSERNA